MPPPKIVVPTVDVDAVDLIQRLHRRFPTELASPGRSIAFFDDLMSECVAAARPPTSSPNPTTVTAAAVAHAFARATGLPRFLVDETQRPDLSAIHKQLSTAVLGQPAVIDVLTDLVAVLTTDLSRGDRPLASLLLVGPTGVGKTETAKAMAKLFYADVSRLVRIDMAEFADSTAAARLIGGRDDRDGAGGLLTGAVQAQPFSLILLDEFEKAHPSVFDLLLQVLGEGRLTDTSGRVADFRNSIVMMTSNLGVDNYREAAFGFDGNVRRDDAISDHFRRQVRQFLRPEMYNRLDRIMAYQPLAPEVVLSLARRSVEAVLRRDGVRAVPRVDVDDNVINRLAAIGYRPQYGARPLARATERLIAEPIGVELSTSSSLPTRIEITTRGDEVGVRSFHDCDQPLTLGNRGAPFQPWSRAAQNSAAGANRCCNAKPFAPLGPGPRC